MAWKNLRESKRKWLQTPKGRESSRRHYERTWRRKHLMRQYGLTEAQYETLRLEQSGVCKICRNPTTKPLCVDHCHTTGRIRGLLCNDCNFVLGFAKDSILVLQSAITYLESVNAA